MSSIFICVTPLQLLISESIIKEKQIEDAIVILLAYQSNSKYDYYYERLRDIAKEIIRVDVIPKNKFTTGLYFYKLWVVCNFKLRRKDKNDFYVASIDNKFVHLILSKSYVKTLFTFDDGTANIIPTSSYYKNVEDNAKRRVLKYFTGSVDMQWIKNNSLEHYTLYSGLPNIITKTRKINLFSRHPKTKADYKKEKVIFLGFPIDESNLTLDKIQGLFNQYNIGYYFPHPREKNTVILDGVIIINTVCIVEDYIKQLLDEDLNTTIEVCGFVSTSLMNMANMSERVELTSFYTDELMAENKLYYDLLSHEGIRLVKVDI